jgi:hypothetical protein
MNRTITRTRRLTAIAAIALAGIAGTSAVAGCGEASEPATTPSTAPSATATPGLPAPIIVEPGETAVTAAVGETIVFNQPDPANTTISTDRPDVLELTQGSDDGSAQFNPAAVAQTAGVAVVTIVAADGTTSSVTITVS